MRRLVIVVLLGCLFAGCGGGSSSPTGPTTETTTAAAPVPAAVSAPAPAPPVRQVIRQYTMAANVSGSYPPGIGGCLIIKTDSPPGETPCGSPARTTGDEGTRGTVTAVPDAGYRWSSSFSSDCPGESTNPCSFAFDRNKVMTAYFGR
jgi:hypothetical protein